MMKKGFFLTVCFSTCLFWAQEKDSLQLSELVVSADAPVTKSTITKSEIQRFNLGQDIPMLLQQTPSAVATSDAGNGIGYSGIRIRGTDASRILVSVDGVPINDSESQSVFWVNMPDLMSNAGSINVQRGVGTSSNGTSNFGGSVQVNSSGFSKQPTLRLQSAGGSFGTFKNTLIAESGNWAKEKLNLRLRLSQLKSEGYVDRASSRLYAYQLEGNYKFSEHSILKLNYFAGKEKTYQAWYGVDSYTLENDRTFNFAGAIYNEDYSEVLGYYDNQIDNYKQDHFFTHWKKKWGNYFSTRLTGFYTYGRGYYEELAQFQNPEDYKIDDSEISDLVRRKWLKNHFYGINTFFNYKKEALRLEGNIALSQYIGNHFGEVINSAFLPLNSKVEYYRNKSVKNEFSSYLKATYRWNAFEWYADAQLRTIDYTAETPISGRTTIDDNPDFNKKYTFFNPKVGANYRLNSGKLYALWAISHREPTRTDLLQTPDIEPERLTDWELGYSHSDTRWSWGTNLYYMKYQDQMVLTGRLDDVGNPIRENSGESYRLGWETNWDLTFSPKVILFGNFSLSTHKNKDYTIDNEGTFENLGDTDIAFSPASTGLIGIRSQWGKIWEFQWANKYVNAQFLDNTEHTSLRLDSYFLSDITVQARPQIKALKEFLISAQFNNIFSQKYESNGYVYDTFPYYYPQAGFNFLLGVQAAL